MKRPVCLAELWIRTPRTHARLVAPPRQPQPFPRTQRERGRGRKREREVERRRDHQGVTMRPPCQECQPAQPCFSFRFCSGLLSSAGDCSRNSCAGEMQFASTTLPVHYVAPSLDGKLDSHLTGLVTRGSVQLELFGNFSPFRRRVCSSRRLRSSEGTPEIRLNSSKRFFRLFARKYLVS